MKGKVIQWKDDKGFGFILPDDESGKIFFHVSNVKTRSRRPQVGDVVFYEPMRDSKNRIQAKSVVIDGVTNSSNISKKPRGTQVEPPKKNVLNFILMIMLTASFIGGIYIFLKTNSIEKAVPLGIITIVTFIALNRQKKPKEKTYSCSRCKKVVPYDSRTIQAWNNGFLKLYCSSCHRKWLNDKPQQNHTHVNSRGGSVLVLLHY
ncbi:cold shock domain-containing protein [sulfur-oxidizing endosymbiont of Gigantopelta aegis]|uniref:cold shock domain-containing protein n=1 Tax=sulfur-oxidizing endosymbiont of Gigantopelta aegis TaxID=2794934 RepID=UPI0018DCBBD9|nr:cold shock domain-containing protein [sulfur-oxidizing endosymbiont of Gigantopelta aegis]